MVMILVLGMLIVAITLTTTFGVDTNALDFFGRQARSREANYMVARSAFELGLVLLRSDDGDVDGAEDIWASGPQEMTWEGRQLRLEVEDEERRIPINSLVPPALPPGAVFQPSEEQDAMAKVLIRFLDNQGLPGKACTYALVDWMDPDSTPTVGGSEVGRDPSIPAKNARLDSLYELTFVQGWTQPTIPPPTPLLGGLSAGGDLAGGQSATSKLKVQAADKGDFQGKQSANGGNVNTSVWSDWFSLYSDGKININTAPKEILKALDDEMTDALVQEIISKRQEGSLSGEEDLRQIAGMNEDLLFRLGRLIRYNSQYFRVRVRVNTPPGPINLDAVVLRDKSNPKVVRWEVH